jgi:hypothetical protein
MSDDENQTTNYTAHVVDTATGRTYTVATNMMPILWWHDGTMDCDCNRGALIGEDMTCGDGRYRVRCVDDAGTVLYEDKEEGA